MRKKLIALLLLSGLCMIGQSKKKSNLETYTSRKEVYEIKYNPEKWIRAESSEWDAEFHDKFNLITAYFIEYDYFISDKKIKSTIEDEFKDFGKIKNLKISKKKINNIEVDYYECELFYNEYLYKYQGFFYSGQGGSIQMQYAAQEEAIEKNLGLINELNNGFSIIE